MDFDKRQRTGSGFVADFEHPILPGFRENSGYLPHQLLLSLLQTFGQLIERFCRRHEEARKARMHLYRTKHLGRQAAASGLQQANVLLHLVLRLRSGRPFIPKGVHRFCSYEEAQQWSIRMQAGKASPGRPL